VENRKKKVELPSLESSYRNLNRKLLYRFIRVTVTRIELEQFSSSDLIRSLDENWGKQFFVELNKSRKVRANSNSNSKLELDDFEASALHSYL